MKPNTTGLLLGWFFLRTGKRNGIYEETWLPLQLIEKKKLHVIFLERDENYGYYGTENWKGAYYVCWIKWYFQKPNCLQFAVHSTILWLTTPAIDWSKTPTPFTGLPEDVLQTTLHYMYAECLPRGLSEDTALKCVKIMSKIPELTHFVKLCDTFLKNTALKQRKYFLYPPTQRRWSVNGEL